MMSNDFSARQHPGRKGRIGATLGQRFERAGGFGRRLPSPTGLLLYGSNWIKWGRWRRPSMAGLGAWAATASRPGKVRNALSEKTFAGMSRRDGLAPKPPLGGDNRQGFKLTLLRHS